MSSARIHPLPIQFLLQIPSTACLYIQPLPDETQESPEAYSNIEFSQIHSSALCQIDIHTQPHTVADRKAKHCSFTTGNHGMQAQECAMSISASAFRVIE